MTKGFEVLKGKVLKKIDGAVKGSDCITFYCDDGEIYKLFHNRCCCETVEVEDALGDIDDLIGHPILDSEKAIKKCVPFGTASLYEISTIKGSFIIRWYGESNYYKESASFSKFDENTGWELYKDD